MLHLDAHTPTARSQTSVLKSDLKNSASLDFNYLLCLFVFSIIWAERESDTTAEDM